jgi:hypothetical protein
MGAGASYAASSGYDSGVFADHPTRPQCGSGRLLRTRHRPHRQCTRRPQPAVRGTPPDDGGKTLNGELVAISGSTWYIARNEEIHAVGSDNVLDARITPPATRKSHSSLTQVSWVFVILTVPFGLLLLVGLLEVKDAIRAAASGEGEQPEGKEPEGEQPEGDGLGR